MASSISRRNFLFGALTTAALTASVALGGCSISATSDGGSSSSSDSASTSGYRTLDEIKESGKIVIGVFSDKSPFGYVDENGEYQGYDVELARQIGTDLGVDVEFVSTEAANRVEYLETNKVDVILANFTVTEERAEKVDFAEAYMNVALGVVSHKDNVVTDLSQVGDRTVIVISGTTAETYLTEHNPTSSLRSTTPTPPPRPPSRTTRTPSGPTTTPRSSPSPSLPAPTSTSLASKSSAIRTPSPRPWPRATPSCSTGSTTSSTPSVARSSSTPTTRRPCWRPTAPTTRTPSSWSRASNGR